MGLNFSLSIQVDKCYINVNRAIFQTLFFALIRYNLVLEATTVILKENKELSSFT